MNHPNEPTEPTNPASSTTAWEEAMSRDFDARVRDLHEAPLDFDSVKGKAHKIKRNRRAAVAGGILGVAAIVTPDRRPQQRWRQRQQATPVRRRPDRRARRSPTPRRRSSTTSLGGVWHQADGDAVRAPEERQPYDSAVIWNDQLVATRWDGEVYSITDVIDAEGKVVDTFDSTSGVAVNEAGTTIAWIDTDGSVMTAWGSGDDDQVSMGTVDLAGSGRDRRLLHRGGHRWPELLRGRGRLHRLRQLRTRRRVACLRLPRHQRHRRAGDHEGVRRDRRRRGQRDQRSDRRPQHVRRALRPDRRHPSVEAPATTRSSRSRRTAVVAAPQSQYDGLGPTQLSILDADSGEETGRYSPEGGFIGTWAWTTDGQLLFDAYDGASWHLISMAVDGSITEIGDPVKGADVDNPFTLIQH